MLSIIIPVYNEEKRIGPSLEKIINYFEGKEKIEVVVVDDGSTDNTRQVLDGFDKEIIKVHAYPTNKGKGYAIKKGLLEAKGDYILLTDSDLSTPIESYSALRKALSSSRLVIGSRGLSDSRVKNKWHKIFFGKVGNVFIQLLLPGIQDTQCGFKLFPKEAVAKIAPMMTINGFGYDFELLFLGRKLGYEVVEIPVSWENAEGSKVKFYHYFTTLKELFTVWLNAKRKKYKIRKGA